MESGRSLGLLDSDDAQGFQVVSEAVITSSVTLWRYSEKDKMIEIIWSRAIDCIITRKKLIQ